MDDYLTLILKIKGGGRRRVFIQLISTPVIYPLSRVLMVRRVNHMVQKITEFAFDGIGIGFGIVKFKMPNNISIAATKERTLCMLALLLTKKSTVNTLL